MTKEDALFFLVRFRTEGINEKLYDALGVAIEALNAQTDKRTETHACDLISRQAALDALNRIEISRNASWYEFYQKALTAVGILPSAQPGIIACGDCKHWICHDRKCGFWNHGVKPLDWCCHAERRTE